MGQAARELNGVPVEVGHPIAHSLGVTKRFGPTVALRGVGLAVRAGESHALVGRNGAGKSTLVAILTGLLRPDAGEVRFSGAPAPPPADRAAWQQRVACVYQKPTIVPALTVGENLFLNAHPTGRRGLVDWGALRRRARALLGEWGVEVDPATRAGELSVEETKLVEIARALAFGTRFIILDEPTAQLDAQAIERLFGRMRAMQTAGVTFLYISHHLGEVYEVCQKVTVLRDARHVLTAPVDEVGPDALVEAMTGEASGLRTPSPGPPRPNGTTALAVEGLSGNGFADVTLSVDGGELVGLAGISGSGKVAVAESIAGLRRVHAGRVRVGARTLAAGSVADALDAGVGFVPQDRHREGLVPAMSIAENASLTVAGQLGPGGGIVSPRRRSAFGANMIRRLGIAAAGPDQCVSDLSGGNQQKVVMARALAREPRVLVLVNPTAGVDVKSKEALLEIVDGARTAGAGVLIVSDELDDLRPCDRVLVLVRGRLVSELPAGWSDQELVATIEGVKAQ
jgi:simple sugar transport system ATP-binding protein